MSGPIYEFLAADHRRLDELLVRAVRNPDAIDRAPYDEFRAGILTHIGMEEKIVLPAAQAANGGVALPIAARLRLEHGAIASLLVPTPTAPIIEALRAILEKHNPLEEDPQGLYAACDELLGAEADAVVDRLRAYPLVPVSPNNDGPRVMESVRRAVERAGFNDEAARLTND